MIDSKTYAVLAKTLTLFLLLVLIFSMSCTNREFGNPLDPSVALKAPTITSVSFLADTAVSLSWQDPNINPAYPGAKPSYEIQMSSDGSTYSSLRVVGRDTLSITVPGVYGANVSYSFRMRTRSTTNTSGYSSVAQASFQFFPPSNLSVSFTKDTSAVLQWQNNSTWTKWILIERSTSQTSGYVFVDSVQAPGTTKSVAGIYRSDTTYYFRVRAKSVNNASAYSTVAQGSLSFPAPSNVTADSITASAVYLHWTDNSSFETGFEIQQSVNDTNSFALVQTVGANITSATITGSFNNVSTYYFRIRAKSFENMSSYSNAASASRAVVEMVFVQGGAFQMGSTSGNSDEQPVHSVTLSNFYIGKYEVTQALWRKVVIWKQQHGSTSLSLNPSQWTSDTLNPVEQVSWNDITLWIGHLNEMLGTNTYRLPTEAEWEYAARGGIHWNDNYTYSGSNNIDSVAWYYSNSSNQTHQRGRKQPNQLGIYDMSGNVWEWCNDWYGSYTSGAQTNPTGPASGTYRVLRGGSWDADAGGCRVSYRVNDYPSARGSVYGFGFRVVRN